jgi:hypothetical protein
MTGHGRGVLRAALEKVRFECDQREAVLAQARKELIEARDSFDFWIAERDGLEASMRILQEVWGESE